MLQYVKGFGNWSGRITVDFIPHEQQRYDTCGDWELVDDHGLQILRMRISQTGNDDMNMCLLMHELNEALVYLFKRDFTQEAVKAVDEFDMRYPTDGAGEPGFDPLCPCYTEHMFAMEAEHGVAAQLALDWNKYTETIGALVWAPPREMSREEQMRIDLHENKFAGDKIADKLFGEDDEDV